MLIRLLFFEGCPHSDATFDLVRRVAGTERPDAVYESIEVGSRPDAVRLRFLGSPTVQINGIDIEPEARNRGDFAVTCRLYGASGVPGAGMIAAAIREAVE